MFSIIRSRLASIACYGMLLPMVLCVLLSIFGISASYIAGYFMITVMLFGLQQAGAKLNCLIERVHCLTSYH